MTRLFGTDGIRGVANQPPLTPDITYRLGRHLVATLLERQGVSRARLVVGRDTRLSGPMLEGALVAGVVADTGDGRCLAHDSSALRKGDRVTFSLTASCGSCFYCTTASLPQKCETMFKYGHTSCEGARGKHFPSQPG